MSTGQQPHSDARESETRSGGDILSSGVVPLADRQPVTLGTVGLFLIGHRKAIQQIADAPAATWLAFSWVILAALFRDYDHADLLRYPGWLAVPLLASTLLAGVLFIVLKLIPDVRASRLPQRIQFRRLLTCFWMTAPLAMIYAIPVERFLSPPEATRWNLMFLALVATWRVLLMIRVVSVLYGFSFFRAICPVLLLADSVAVFVMIMIPIPLLDIMGGIKLSESSELINEARLFVIALGVMTWPIWLLGVAFTLFKTPGVFSGTDHASLPVSLKHGPWMALGAGFAVMVIACLFTQPEQQRAETFRQLLLSGKPAQAITYVSQFTPEQLPPHWDAPPSIDHGERTPDLFAILDAIVFDKQTPDWLRELYSEKLLSLRGSGYSLRQFWFDLNEDELVSLINFLRSSPEVLQQFERSNGESWEDEGSIRCIVAELAERDFTFSGNSQPLPPDLVQRLFTLDDPHKVRRCGTNSEVQNKLDAKIEADSKKRPPQTGEHQ